MERSKLLAQLAEVESQIASGTELITRQRKLLAALDAKEVDRDAIQILLASLESSLMLHLQARERLRAEIAKLVGSTQKPKSPDR